MTAVLAPPMAYFGGKTRLASRLVSLLPPHEHYVEPFAGSLAVLLAKAPSTMETVNDLDGALMRFWRVLRERPDELLRVCALTPHSRAEHAGADLDDPEVDELELARRVWVRISQGRAGLLRRTGWRHYVHPAGGSTSMPDYLDAYLDRMAAAVERLHHVSLECRPAMDVIDAYDRPSVAMYLDPPYLPGTRVSGHYRHEMTLADHTDLLDRIRTCRAGIVLSGYPSALYDQRLADWDRIDIPTSTGQGGRASGRTEVVWSNRPIAQPTLFTL